MRDRVIKMTRWLLAWSLFALGDAVSRAMVRADFLHLYPLYNKLMWWSSDIQGPTAGGPWSRTVSTS